MHPTMNGRSTRLGITFIKDKGGETDRLTFHQGPVNIPATRVKEP